MKVPPSRSPAVSLPSRARPTRSARAAAISATVRLSARGDHRDDESAFGGDCEADVRGRVELDRVLRERGVHLAVAHQGDRADLGQDVGHGRPLVRVALEEQGAELLRLRHVGRHRDLECGDRPRLGQAARDRLSQRRQLDALDLALRSGRRRGGRCLRRRRRDRGPLDVLRDDPALRAGAGQSRQVDPSLARDPPRERRRLDPAAVPGGRDGGGLRHSSRRALRRDRHLLARRRFLHRLRAGPFRDGLPRLADVGDRGADRHLALGDDDLQQHAGRLRLDLLRHLVGVELEQRLTLLHLIALGDEPADDRSCLHPLAQPGKDDLASHGRPSSAPLPGHRRRAARRTPPSPARTAAA